MKGPNVDFDEDEVEDIQQNATLISDSPDAVEARINQTVTSVKAMISRGNYSEAVLTAINNHPFGKDPQTAKVYK